VRAQHDAGQRTWRTRQPCGGADTRHSSSLGRRECVCNLGEAWCDATALGDATSRATCPRTATRTHALQRESHDCDFGTSPPPSARHREGGSERLGSACDAHSVQRDTRTVDVARQLPRRSNAIETTYARGRCNLPTGGSGGGLAAARMHYKTERHGLHPHLDSAGQGGCTSGGWRGWGWAGPTQPLRRDTMLLTLHATPPRTPRTVPTPRLPRFHPCHPSPPLCRGATPPGEGRYPFGHRVFHVYLAWVSYSSRILCGFGFFLVFQTYCFSFAWLPLCPLTYRPVLACWVFLLDFPWSTSFSDLFCAIHARLHATPRRATTPRRDTTRASRG